jgi:acyl-CoA synthetase (AMP-forming)/AMP-acid ligase II
LPVGQIGELVVRGPQVMQGYWQPDGSLDNSIVLDDGWLDTGDVAVQDKTAISASSAAKRTPSFLANTPSFPATWRRCCTRIRA